MWFGGVALQLAPPALGKLTSRRRGEIAERFLAPPSLEANEYTNVFISSRSAAWLSRLERGIFTPLLTVRAV